ncbi:FtsX-like permease family protein [Cellulomonas sp. APG4]|uniref:ABC transporter permease n=1 Tax=Cellulomonas sp. APG4 TaxID=1538656 RepID=UPI00137A1F3B|nr:ABC transporter permease [Cellulomonas sp. APG4]NCT92293.1 FtsX-like permease family protein [Cellulomonas sp. APG4]
MLRLTLAQMRRSLGRLAAAGVAIAIGTAFLTATLLAGNALTRTTYDALTTTFADADLVVLSNAGLTPTELDALREVPGVDAVGTEHVLGVEMAGPGGVAWTGVRTEAVHPRLESSNPAEGRLPSSGSEVALPGSLADRLEVGLGDTVTSLVTAFTEDPAAADGTTTTEVRKERLTVVGVLEDGAAEVLGMPGDAIVSDTTFDAWAGLTGSSDETAYLDLALMALAPGSDVGATQDAARAALEGTDAIVRTQDEHAMALLEELTGQTRGLTSVVLAFGAVALLVAALVIANTFQVLVAQRTRTLALLRCVGADRRQLRRSVVVEALLLGVAASLTGLLVGAGVIQVVLAILGSSTDVPVPATITPSVAAVVVPLLAGVIVTVGASLTPARAATRVSPLAALAPVTAPRLAERGGRVRAWFAGLLVVGGTAGLVLGMLAVSIDPMLGLGIAVLGGAVSFVGVLVGAVFWVPRVVGLLGRGAARLGGPPARLAAANSIRNPRRTSATSAALLIGVTLVAMMATGAATTRVALDRTLDERFAVDVAVTGAAPEVTRDGLPEGFVTTVSELDGVGATSLLTGAPVEVTWPDGGDAPMSVTAQGVELDEVRELMRAPEHVDGLTDGTVLVPEQVTRWYGIPESGTVTISGSSGELTLDVVTTSFEADAVLLTKDTLDEIAPGAPANALWLTLDDLDSASELVTTIADTAADTELAVSTAGAAVERAFYQRVVDTLLAVVVGLLGVAVVIALVGVANTLSLSVIERRRESATLRAIGLSRRQLRSTLAVEGVLIALVGALVGSLLGLVYGWAGAWTLLGELADVSLVVPWAHLGLVLVVAVLAGLLASVLPGRSAARTSPVEALAVD